MNKFNKMDSEIKQLFPDFLKAACFKQNSGFGIILLFLNLKILGK